MYTTSRAMASPNRFIPKPVYWSQGVSVGLVCVMLLTCLSACPGDNDGPDFPQPEVRQSSGGVLETTLNMSMTTNFLVDRNTGTRVRLNTLTYEGALTGPTLRLIPGDTLALNLLNNFPPNPEQRSGLGFPHDQYSTNMHTHGLTVTSEGIGDNVLRQMPPSSNPYSFEVVLPTYHPSGTFWYHPHKHGSVSYQFFGGMSGFLIIDGAAGSLDTVPEVEAAQEVLMAFQGLRVKDDGTVPFVNQEATQFSDSFANPPPPIGLWDTFKGTTLYVTTNGEVNPILHMRQGEVQRWRMLNALSGLTLAVTLENTSLHVIANDGLTVPEMLTLAPNVPYVMGAGNRVDVLVKAGAPGTYQLQAIDPSRGNFSVTPQGVDPGPRVALIGNDFPALFAATQAPDPPAPPVTLATIVVEAPPQDMALPSGPLPVPADLVAIQQEILNREPDATRKVAFEICGRNAQQPSNQLSSCQFFFARYNADYWGGTVMDNLLMMRDADDDGVPIDPSDPKSPHTGYVKEGLFTAGTPLFDNMFGGNVEEWTVLNRTFSDHPFHIHQNPFLLTHVNGVPLPVPEWRDTILVPAAVGTPPNINEATPGSVTFRTHYDPNFPGNFVIHCHILTHEDVGMMQQLEVKVP